MFRVCSGRSQTAPPETAVREKLAILEEDEPEAPLSKVLLEIRVSLPTVLFLLFRPAGDEGGNDMAMTSQDGHCFVLQIRRHSEQMSKWLGVEQHFQ